MACVLCGAAAAQEHRERPREAREEYHAPRGGAGNYERAQPSYRGAPSPIRREPGGALYGYAPPSPYSPPHYAAPPPRRPNLAMPGWRAAPEEAPGVRAPRMASLGWVIESIQRRSPGRQLDAEVGYLGERPVYRVLWITVQGRRMDYIVDAETGAILSGR